jgi:hypothetical protein
MNSTGKRNIDRQTIQTNFFRRMEGNRTSEPNVPDAFVEEFRRVSSMEHNKGGFLLLAERTLRLVFTAYPYPSQL